MTRARTLADMISDGVIGTTELADDVITPVKLDETGNYSIAQLNVNGTVTSDGLYVSRAGGSVGSSNVAYINVTSSYGGLSINASTGNNAFIELMENGTKTAGINSDAANDITSIQSSNGHALTFNTGNTNERLRITHDGDIGIGNLANPLGRVEINDPGAYSNSNMLFLTRNENSRYNAYAGFGDQGGANQFGWRFGTTNNSVDYPAMYIVDSNVGVGTGGLIPSRFAVRLDANNDGNNNNWSNDMATFHIGGNTSTSQALGISGSTATGEMYITSLQPSVAWKGMAFRAANYKFLHEGSATTAPFLFMNNFGISFDQGSNYLDDYEEGTFTPSITIGGVTPGGLSVHSAPCHYTKVGRLVTCTMGINATWSSSSSGDMRITGLPFTESRGGGYIEPGFAIGNKGTSNFTHAAVVASTSDIVPYKNDQPYVFNNIDFNNGGSSGFWFHGTLAYHAT